MAGHLKAEFKGKAERLAWTNTLASIEQVQATISSIQRDYETNIKYTQARELLHRFSIVVLHYGTVLDMLSQQHPEYVSLVWGSVKFLLIGITGHARLVAELAEAMVSIGDVLPRTQLNAELYQNDMMRTAVARLYTQLLRFFRAAMEWYSRSGFERVVSAVFKPFECGLKDIIEKIKMYADLMDKIAESSMRVDQRMYNLELQARLERVEFWCDSDDQAMGNLTAVVEDVVALIQALGEWIDAPASALLILNAAQGKHIATELIGGIVQARTQQVCWTLSASSEKDEA
ncbi:hypothetical protein N0V93_010361 [Gnomoniopsis smithogilvyi]|uniref:DUF7708 domain-containing protein n=1 Tax=Gnomoniopsis smithogilvyi TaxID=1191159 RepID=A0A9W8YIH1_9PEZI|nr:hypothetical protein N0V93_010361 [Gnomoniopsis smithogilvyi]